ncbi:hypothetical protein BV511_13250 [Methylorubrum extorquens]|uniref:hypothetical protein n=1 Tax=Methylorubrum extorquens TaxID=408 RepID=UPI000972BAD0|nr:hypothetical protein [Methylorubrum extorquens]APX85597.1 hypothetical protein BV511_13250 [Methylorubrum extorquens]
MSFLNDLFDGKTPTVAMVAAAIADLEAQLPAASTRIANARAALGNVADMSDDEHYAADAELAAALRADVRLRAQIGHLEAVREQAAKEEATAQARADAEALRARAAAAQKRVDTEHMPLIERYEAKAGEIAEIAAALHAIEMEVVEANEAIERARKGDPSGSHPELVVDSTARFRTGPDARRAGREHAVPAPFRGLRLPPARLDAAAFWPRGQ